MQEKCNHTFKYWSFDGDGEDVEANNEEDASVRQCSECDMEWWRNPLSNKWE
jgi:hypothetical protein